MSWEYHGKQLSPRDVAAKFAATFSDTPRQVDHLDGAWAGTTYTGRFGLVDGTREYEIFGRNGHWSVQPTTT